MKVAFDQHVPSTLAKVFIALSKEKVIQKCCQGLIFETAAEYAPQASDRDYIKSSDVPWLDRFAESKGHAIISGDKKMRQRPHERLALYQHDFVVIFFEASWSEWDFYKKSALMLHWWPQITTKIKTADKGTFWVVPADWPQRGAGELRNVSFGLAKLLRDNPERKPRPIPPTSTSSVRKKKRPEETRQTSIPLSDAGNVEGSQ